jgi:hypothetical protein
MGLKSTTELLALVCSFVLVQVASAAPSIDPCDLPKELQAVVARKYPGSEVVKISDLNEDDKSFFRKDHGDACPGAAMVDFYGDSRPTFAMALLTKNEQRDEYKTKLVLAHRSSTAWEISVLGATGGPAPVVWSEGPGVYKDVYGRKELHASHAVIVFCGYESWAIVYAWTNNNVDKVWIRD